jgi:xylulose-5-phosphate/fructose-6-phosphate phosphoketolase
VDRVPRFAAHGAPHFKQFLRDKLVDHKRYVDDRGDDMPEIKNWKWPY